MLFHGQHLYNTDKTISLRVCLLSQCAQYVAVADMHNAMRSDNLPKPDVYKVSELPSYLLSSVNDKAMFELSAKLTFSDTALKKQGHDKWLLKRDKKWAAIQSLCSHSAIQQYLFGRGIGKEIAQEIDSPFSFWKTRGAYFNAINRYITFGMTANALLPFKLAKVGTNYKTFDKPSDEVIKRGRGGKYNQFSRSKTRGVAEQDKINIKKTLNYFRAKSKKFAFKQAFEVFQDNYETTVLTRDVNGKKSEIYIPFDLKNTISFNQFYYHTNQILSRPELIQLSVGKLNFEKDFKDRQGLAHDGLLGATQRYEVDATVLDLYVRYPYDTSGRLSMGRPVLYVVVDVFSTMIVGFYLGFDGPNWDGVSQALVNACMNKVDFAKRYGLKIAPEDWPAHHIPKEISIDNGSEYPDGLLTSVLQNEIGVQAINIAAVYRGDAKGTCERVFGVLNNLVIHFLAGSIFTDSRGEQHSSNQSFYDYDALVKILITEIIYHNSTADRLKKFNWQCMVDDIDINPASLYLHSLETDMNGGRPTKKEDEAKVRWAFLREETAVVRDYAIWFDGLEYESPCAKDAGWYSKAKHNGWYKICVKRVRDWANSIWHKTETGEYVELRLKNVNNESPWLDRHWEEVLHQLEKLKDKRSLNHEHTRQKRAEKRSVQSAILAKMHDEIGPNASSDRLSIQPRIKERKEVQKQINTAQYASDTRKAFTQEMPSPAPTNDDFDLDEELYQ